MGKRGEGLVEEPIKLIVIIILALLAILVVVLVFRKNLADIFHSPFVE